MEAYKNYIAYQQQAQPAYYYVAQPYTAGGTPIATPLHLNTAQYYYYPQGPLSAGAQPLSQPQSQQPMQLISGPLSSNSAAFQLNPMTNQMAFNQQNNQSASFQQQQSSSALVSPRSTAYAQQQAQLAIGQYQPKQQAHNASVPILQLPTLNYPFNQLNQQTPGGITPNTMIQSPQQHASALQAQFSQQQSSYYLQQQAQATQLTPKSAAKIDNNNNSLNRLNNNQRSLRNGSYNSSSGHFNKSARYNRPNNGYSSGGKQGFKSGGSTNEAQLHDNTSDEQGMPVINSSHEASN